jgi:hypothetical protein
MLRLVALSGNECVQGLLSAGFRPGPRIEGSTVLTRGDRLVVVPDIPLLAPEGLTAILRDAGIDLREFFALVAEAPTTRRPRFVPPPPISVPGGPRDGCAG